MNKSLQNVINQQLMVQRIIKRINKKVMKKVLKRNLIKVKSLLLLQSLLQKEKDKKILIF